MFEKILFISEALSAPFDEGIKKLTFSLVEQLTTKKDVLSVTKMKNDTTDMEIIKIN